jgi:hypothetical protein
MEKTRPRSRGIRRGLVGLLAVTAASAMTLVMAPVTAHAAVTPLAGSITLTWDRPGDNDLWVTANGVTTYYGDVETSIGTLTTDDDTQRRGPEIFLPAAGVTGPFTIKVHCYERCLNSTAHVVAEIGNRKVDFGTHKMTRSDVFWEVGSINLNPNAAPTPAPTAAGECWQTNEQFVTAAYQAILGRDPTAAELAYGSTDVLEYERAKYGLSRADYAIEDIIGDLMDSQEYTDRNRSDRAKIRDLYEAAFHRAPTAAEYETHLATLNDGTSDFSDVFANVFVTGGPWTRTLGRLCSDEEVKTEPPTYTVGPDVT